MSSRWLPALAVLLILAPSTMADAAILIEARKQRDALRMVIDAEQQRALIATPRGQSVIDLARNRIYVRQAPAARGRSRSAGRRRGAGAYRVTPWGPGPVVAGHATVYHVITYHDEICAEMLVSGWMQPFMAPVVQALDLLDDMPAPGRWRLRAHSVRGVRRGRLADAGREDRPSDLRDHRDPLRLRAAARASWPRPTTAGCPRSARRSGRASERRAQPPGGSQPSFPIRAASSPVVVGHPD